MRRSLIRWTLWLLKWGGLCATLSLVAAFIVSGWWALNVSTRWGGFEIWAGLIALYPGHGSSVLPACTWRIEPNGYPGWWWGVGRLLESHSNTGLIPLIYGGPIKSTQPAPRLAPSQWSHWSFQVTLLAPAIILFVPTLLAWLVYRRYPIGCCRRCGYDLTGNVSGRCSECGKAVRRHPARPKM